MNKRQRDICIKAIASEPTTEEPRYVQLMAVIAFELERIADVLERSKAEESSQMIDPSKIAHTTHPLT